VPASRDRRLPIHVELGRRLIALREIRKRLRLVEADRRLRRTFAVGTMAPRATSAVNRLTGREIAGCRLDGLCGGSRRGDEDDSDNVRDD
jgi:hypothetical protein